MDDGSRKKKWVAWAVAAAIFVVLMLVTPAIPQDEAYHHFADHRTLFLGTPRARLGRCPPLVPSPPLRCILCCCEPYLFAVLFLRSLTARMGWMN